MSYLSSEADTDSQRHSNGLKTITPTLDHFKDQEGNEFPYIASHQLTVFSILDTQNESLASYRFDTTQLNSSVIKFDELLLKQSLRLCVTTIDSSPGNRSTNSLKIFKSRLLNFRL